MLNQLPAGLDCPAAYQLPEYNYDLNWQVRRDGLEVRAAMERFSAVDLTDRRQSV